MTFDVPNFLRNKRKGQGLSVKEVCQALQGRGVEISEKTLYGWERGHRQPDADEFVALCQIYGAASFSEVEKIASPSEEAMEVARIYDKLDSSSQHIIQVVIQEWKKQEDGIREELSSYEKELRLQAEVGERSSHTAGIKDA